MTLSTRIATATGCTVVLMGVAVALLVHGQVRSTILPMALHQIEARAAQLARQLDSYVRSAGADVLAMSAAPDVAALARTSGSAGASGSGPRDGSYEGRIAALFAGQLRAQPSYLQFRLIGVADGGREIVRVDRSGPGEAVRIVPDAELQKKGHRRYAREALALPPGGLYVSPIELNREHGLIERPPAPVLRVATSVPGPQGETIGIVIVNVDLRPVLGAMRDGPEAWTTYVVNERGDYLVHPDPDREFRFDYDADPIGLRQDFPELAGVLAGESIPGRLMHDPSGGQVGAAAVAARPADGPSVAVVATLPYAAVMAPLRSVLRSSLLVIIPVALAAFVLSLLFARWVAGPVREVESALEAQAERAALLAAVVESSEDSILTKDLDGKITSWNSAAERMYGHSAGEVVGRSVDVLVPPDRRAELHSILEKVRRGEQLRHFETVRVAKSGRSIDVSLSVSPVRSPAGDVIGASSIARDVSRRKQADEMFRLAVEASPSGMVMVDASGSIILVNAETENLFGYSREELVGRSIDVLVPEGLRSEHRRHRAAFLDGPLQREMGAGRDLFALRKDGREIPVEIGLTPIRTSRGMLVLGAIVDISQRNAAAAAVASKTRELERSNAELGQFAYVASHDLQEPLRMVTSFTELLAERYGDRLDERGEKYVRYIVEGARRMRTLVNDLLAYSRVGTQGRPMRPVQAAAVVAGVLDAMNLAIAEAGAEVTCDSLPEVQADEVQLMQLLQNLIHNAIKFRSDRPPRIHVGVRRNGDEWDFFVRDNGIGIPEKEANRVFQMFQRLHERGKYDGSGIGLTIAQKIVERHGGRLWVESVVGEGSTFHFTMPEKQGVAA